MTLAVVLGDRRTNESERTADETDKSKKEILHKELGPSPRLWVGRLFM